MPCQAIAATPDHHLSPLTDPAKLRRSHAMSTTIDSALAMLDDIAAEFCTPLFNVAVQE